MHDKPYSLGNTIRLKGMSKIFTIIMLALLTLGGSSCKDWLDLRPESDLVLEEYWLDETHVNEVLSACYRSLTEVDIMERFMVWGELRSDNVTYGNNMPVDMYRMVNVDITTSNWYCQWGSLYRTINYCNNWLYYAPDVTVQDPNFTEAKLNTLKAEVLTIRSLVYFYLVRAFKEVPWVDQPSIDDNQNYYEAKSPEDVVLSKIIEDLQWALTYARDKFDIEDYNKGRITKNAIRALLADIYLWKQDYTSSIQYCDQIMLDENLMLVDGEDVIYDVFFKGNSTESIFELQFSDQIQFNHSVRNFYGGGDVINGWWNYPGVLVTGAASPFKYSNALGIEGENDLRKKDFLYGTLASDSYYVFKYAGVQRSENQNGNSFYYYRNNTANWIVYRLSDIMLMKAEALVELETDYEEVMNLVNTTFLRSNPDLEGQALTLDNYNNKGELSKLVLRERQRELMFEGKRWFDLMRLARRENSTGPLLTYMLKKFSSGSNANAVKMSVMESLYLPIHSAELNANPELVQNPFYDIENEGTTSK